MKKNNNKMRMLRPADGFLPLALIITSVLGRSTASEKLFMCALFPALFALASARGLRIAFSEQPSMRKVAGSVKLALALQFVGAFAFLVIDLIRNHGQFVMTNTIYICAGMLLNIEHVFYEYLYATGDGTSAAFVRAITAALTAGGIMMTSVASGDGLLPYGLEWLLGGAALSAVVAALIGRGIGGKFKGRFNNRVLKCAPPAMIQTAIYPVMWLLALQFLNPLMYDGVTGVPFFSGLLVYELSRTPFRRDAAHSKTFNIAMLVVVLIGGILIGLNYVPQAQIYLSNIMSNWAHELAPTGVMLVAAALCAFGMYGSIIKRETKL